jgi:methylmalonyl-CoA carboxyltransferase large subunit
MKTDLPNGLSLATNLDAIVRELERLNERVAALEANAAPQRPAATAPAPMEELSEELVLIISAAVAAFLGKKAHVRQVRLLGSLPWAQQGRVIIQASHALGERTDRRQT